MGKQASAGDGNKAIEKPNLWLICLWSPFSPTAYANSLAPPPSPFWNETLAGAKYKTSGG